MSDNLIRQPRQVRFDHELQRVIHLLRGMDENTSCRETQKVGDKIDMRTRGNTWIDIILSVLTSLMFISGLQVKSSLTTSVFPSRAAQYKAVPSNSPLTLMSKLLTWDCTWARSPSLTAVKNAASSRHRGFRRSLMACDRQIKRQTDRQTDKETDRQTEKETDRQTDRKRDRQTDSQSDRQKDRKKGSKMLTLHERYRVVQM